MGNSSKILIICDGFEYILSKGISIFKQYYPHPISAIDALYFSNRIDSESTGVSDIDDEVKLEKALDKILVIKKRQSLISNIFAIRRTIKRPYGIVYLSSNGDRQFFILAFSLILGVISFSAEYCICDLNNSRIEKRSLGFMAKAIVSKFINLRMFNLLLNRVSMFYRTKNAWGYPDSFVIEPTNICNLRCQGCVSGTEKMSRPKGMMEIDKFKSLLDECARFIRWLDFSGYGEPFLHKDTIEMIRYAKLKGVAIVQCDTNANLSFSSDDFHRLVSSGLDYLVVSIDGVTQQAYEANRGRGDLNLVTNFVRMLSAAKSQRNSLKPIIIAQMIVTAQNYSQVDNFKEFALGLGADGYRFKNFWLNDIAFSVDKLAEILPPDDQYRSYGVINGVIRNRSKMSVSFCRALWDQAFITWDGVTMPCCFDPNALMLGDNVFGPRGLSAAWNGKKYTKLRKAVCRDKSLIEICKFCPAY